MNSVSIDNSGWVIAQNCVHHPSPNYEARPSNADRSHIRLLVIHCISLPEGLYDTGCVENLFCNQLDTSLDSSFETLLDQQGNAIKVSAHLLIARDGSSIQFVSLDKQAWHGGVSRYQGEEHVNAFSIGIELEGTIFEYYTKSQYQSLVRLTKAIKRTYPAIKSSNIVGHSDVAIDRKYDPGPLFDWAGYLNGL